MQLDKILSDVYYDPANKDSFASARKLYNAVKKTKKDITFADVEKWLRKQETYTVYKKVSRVTPSTPIIPLGLDDQWEIDLFHMDSLAKYNKGIRYGLLAIDTFSRFLWVRGLLTKKSEEVAEAFLDILSLGRRPNKVKSDLGREFLGRIFEDMLKKENIKHFYSYTSRKAAFAERSIKTIKGKIFKYISATQSYKYIDKLQDIVSAYNSSVHSSIGIAPNNVTKENESEVRLQAYLARKKRRGKKKKYVRRPYKFKVGDKVRISYTKGTFQREYSERWSHEIYTVERRYRRHDSTPVYILKDWNETSIKGGFAEEELQMIDVDEDTKYKIDKILKRRTVNGERQVLVSWQGWSKRFDSWIPASEVTDIKTATRKK